MEATDDTQLNHNFEQRFRRYVNSFSGIPVITKQISGLIIILYLISLLIPSSIPFLALIPGYTTPPYFRIWNLFTSGYFEIYLFQVVLNVFAFLFIGKNYELLWGTKEFLKFIILVNACSGIATFFLFFFFFFFLGDETIWFNVKLCGFSGVVAAFSVVVKQSNPEQELPLLYVTTIRAKNLPALILLVNVVFFLVGLPSECLPFVFFGIYIGWIYLRFFQVKSEGIRGDMSDSFAFVSFFPESLHPFIGLISNSTFKIIRLFSCFRNLNSQSEILSKDNNEGSLLDAERRRAKALKTLDQRLNQEQKQNTEQNEVMNV